MSYKNSKNKNKASNSSYPIFILVFGASLVTLYFNSKLQDPFNSPKMWLLLGISAWLLGYLIFELKKIISNKIFRNFMLIILFFVLSGLFAALNTDVLYVAFLGETQRRNGYLSYLALAIIALSAAINFRVHLVKNLSYGAFLTGLILSVYGLLQINGIDFVSWNNPYNAIISTVGNPNFAGAVMAMMAVIIFGPVLNNGFSKLFRTFSFVLVLTLIYTIFLSEARQGLISVAIGIGTFLIVRIYQVHKISGHIFAGASVVVGLFSVLGMLQIGPLTSILYKNSVSVRGYYWRAGLKMFTENPLTGVGLDRYGAYFKEFREVNYPLTYGFNLTSSNAHDLPIQLFATGGILFGLSYLILIAFIFARGIIAIRSNTGLDQLLITSVFSAWLAYQAQSIISIDNIGISIWGWLLGGAVVGISIKSNNISEIKNSNKSLLQPLASMSLILIVIIFVSILYKGESSMYEARQRFNPQAPENRQPLYESATKTINGSLVDPNYKVMAAAYLVASGFTEEGLKALEQISIYDPRNLDNLNYLADYNQQLNRLENSNKYRLIVAKQDPWNTRNYLQLGRNYKALGNYTEMNKMLSKINFYDQISEESKAARSELVQP